MRNLYLLQKFQDKEWIVLEDFKTKDLAIQRYDEELNSLKEGEKLVVSLYGGAVKKSW